MKRWFHVLLYTTLVGQPVLGQTVEIDTLSGTSLSNRFTLGVDVFKNVPYMFFANRVPLYDNSMILTNRGIVEVILRKKKREGLYQTALLGYSQLEAYSPRSVERQQNMQGLYGKLGNEWTLGHRRRGHSTFGLRGLVTYCRYATDLVYPGPTFGDYRSRVEVNNMGVGIDPYYAFDVFVGPRWLLRWETRWTHHYRIFGKGYTPYYPGVGVAFGTYDLSASLGSTVQLHYRFQSRTVGR
jgi:hypothetical protein